MRNLLMILGLIAFVPALLLGGTPTIDGNFDGTGVWGAPILTADGVASSLSGANAIALYVTNDENYVYLGANVDAASWMAWAFLINTKPGGGRTDSWSRNIDYAHADPPDFILRGHFVNHAQFHTWNGTGWDGVGVPLPTTEFAENVPDNNNLYTNMWVECRIPHSSIDNAGIGNIQFFITGDQNYHGCFDACPNDDNATDWNDHSSLSNYSSDTPLPVDLQNFSVNLHPNGIMLTWITQSELNNLGFEIYRSDDDDNYKLIATYETNPELKGLLNSTAGKTYGFLDEFVAANTTYYYKLADVDVNGHRTFHGPLKIQYTNNSGDQPSNVLNDIELLPNYPNPFNPSTKLSIRIGGDRLLQIPTELYIYNALGQKVATIVKQDLSPGVYEFEWNGRDDAGKKVPSGIYFQTLITPQFRSSRPMILMK